MHARRPTAYGSALYVVRQKVWWLVRGVKRKKSAAGEQIRQGEVVRQAGEVVSDFFVHAPWRRSVVAHFSCYVLVQ